MGASHNHPILLTSMKVLILVATLALAVLAEPPAPNQNTYLPPSRHSQPSQEYGAPSQRSQYDHAPSQQYGAPSQRSQYDQAPSQQYGAPSQQYGAPSQFGQNGQAGARNTFAPPAARVSFRFGNSNSKSRSNGNGNGYPAAGASARTPSATYGAPSFNSAASNSYNRQAAPSSQYGAPSFNGASSNGFARQSTPSSQYGAPSFNSGSSSQFNSRVNTPSSSYGAPSFDSFERQTPSSQYGAPSFNSAPSSSYGAPEASNQVATFNSAPSNSYLPPQGRANGNSHHAAASTPSARYGAPSSNGFNARTPSTQYGAPSANGFGSRTPSTQYGAPSHSQVTGVEIARGQFGQQQQYNHHTPSNFGSSARASTPSAQYGAPAARDSYSQGASSYQQGPAPVYGPPGARSGATTEDPLAEPASYEYTYDVNDAASGSDFGHKEGRDGETTWGEYRVQLPDGRTQVVKYEADENGYKPQIEYEENNNGANGYARGGQQQGGPY